MSRGRFVRVFACSALLVLAAAPDSGLRAQTEGASPELVEAYRAAYREMLQKRNTDVPSLLHLADLAEQVGEPQGAARALDRALRLEPSLAYVRLRLAKDYRTLGENTLARAELQRIVEDRNALPQVVASAKEELASLGSQAEHHRLEGWAGAGAAYDSNANLGVTGNTVLFRGKRERAPGSSRKADDESLYGLLFLKHSYSAGGARAYDAWESTLDGYASEHLEQQHLTYHSVVLATGPRFGSADLASGGKTFTPKLIANWSAFGRQPYAMGAGAIVEGTYQMAGRLVGDLALSGVYESYHDTNRIPDNSDAEGWQTDGGLGTTVQVGRGTAFRLGLLGGRDFALKGWQANTHYGLELRASQTYAAPFGLTSGPWSSSMGARWVERLYDSPDRAVDPDTERRDDLLRLDITTSIPLTKAIAFDLRGDLLQDDSNVRNYNGKDLAFSAGLRAAF